MPENAIQDKFDYTFTYSKNGEKKETGFSVVAPEIILEAFK